MPPIAEYHSTGAQIQLTPGADVSAGDVVAYGGGIAIYEADQVADRPVGASIEGVFELPKVTGVGSDYALGAAVGWDTTTKKVRALSGADLYAGRVHKPVTTADTFVLVKINAPLAGSTA